MQTVINKPIGALCCRRSVGYTQAEPSRRPRKLSRRVLTDRGRNVCYISGAMYDSSSFVLSKSSHRVSMPVNKLPPYHPSQPEPNIRSFDISAVADAEQDKPAGDHGLLPNVSRMSVSTQRRELNIFV